MPTKVKSTISMRMIHKLGPCYDPTKFASKGWSGSVVEILQHPDIPIQDKFWVVCRKEFIDSKTLRLFAVWCARQSLQYWKNPDQRSIDAIDVAERYANGEATEGELKIAQKNATTAARTAYAAAAYATTAYAAAAAAAYATTAAPIAAAAAATTAAATAAATYATTAYAAAAATTAYARDKAGQEQLEQLLKMLKEAPHD